MTTHRSLFASLLVVSSLAVAACNGETNDPSGASTSTSTCPDDVCAKHVGTRADGTIDLDAKDVWPARGAEPAALTPDEHAKACAELARCWGTESERSGLFALCLDAGFGFFWEERAVPTGASNERWTYEARRVLDAAGDCSVVTKVKTPRPSELICEEAGCWIAGAAPKVTCEGTVATVTRGGLSFQRDCAHAFAACDPSSKTGCTDRAPIGCEAGAKDRCDGEVAIGCDSTGKVTFHDCARVPGGKCALGGDGAACLAVAAIECTAGKVSCEGSDMVVCAMGKKVALSPAAAGLAGCVAQ